MRIASVRVVLVVILLIALPRLASAADAPKKKMNVLFIAVDDLRPELGCYGGAAKTPNIDALAARGTLFDRAYCQQAVCSPSRTSMLTGRRPDTTKIYDLETHFRTTIPDVVTLPQYFKENGYFAQSFGKIFHGGLNDPKSWSVPHTDSAGQTYSNPATLKLIRDRAGDPDFAGAKNKGTATEIADCADNVLNDGWTADRAIEAMKKLGDKPFFLAVGFIKPHLPFVAPKKYFDLYPPEAITLAPNPNPPANVPQLAMTNFAELRNYTDMPKTGPITDEQAKVLRRGYYAATSYMDAQVGRVLKQLDEQGLRDSTIIVLWGDHGWQLGDVGMWCKHTNFEIATRAAFLVSVPGQKSAGSKSEALVEYVDVYPSLCELAGLPLPEGLEGTSFVPVVNDPARQWKSAAFSQYPRLKDIMGYSMRTDRYRYTEWVKKDDHTNVVARELYDQQNDPTETKNIAGEASEKETIAKLSDQLRAGWKAAAPKP